MIRIANGQGFWGDWLEAPVRLVQHGPVDYLMLDYLAEVDIAIESCTVLNTGVSPDRQQATGKEAYGIACGSIASRLRRSVVSVSAAPIR